MLRSALRDVATVKCLLHFYCSPVFASLQVVNGSEPLVTVLATARVVLMRCRFYEDMTAGLIEYFRNRGEYRLVNTHQSNLDVMTDLRIILSTEN